jgi:hypothetical protein
MAAFADNGSARLRRSLAGLWATIFPDGAPDRTTGWGSSLNSNAETHFHLPTRWVLCRRNRPALAGLPPIDTRAPAGSWLCIM